MQISHETIYKSLFIQSKGLLKKIPVILRAYDLLEWAGEDIRQKPFDHRNGLLKNLVAPLAGDPGIPLDLSPTMEITDWQGAKKERDRSREKRSEGLMLKKKEAPYRVGRKKGDWWKWKVAPLTVDAVLTYAMRGHGRRSNLFTDYTFALWDEKEDGTPHHVFEIAFEGIAHSKRHKSGVATRFPRILRWRQDKTPEEADTLSTIKNLIP